MSIGDYVKPKIDPSRGTYGPPQASDEIVLDKDILAEIQRGFFEQPQFFGNHQASSNFGSFSGGVDLASLFSGFSQTLRSSTVVERDPESSDYQLTQKEYDAVISRANFIFKTKAVPQDMIEDFLFILVSINDLASLKKIADAVQLPELADASLIRKPFAILSVPGLEKIAFMASALRALIKAFGRFGSAESNSVSGTDDISSIFSELGNMLGGFGAGGSSNSKLADTPAPNRALGNYMSELILGQRIPMSVISKNPELQSPSYVGKALFGEAGSPLSVIDVDQLFNKKIGVFGKPSSGGATSMFGISNFNSFPKELSVDDLVSKMMFGNTNSSNGHKYNQKQTALSKIQSVVGALPTDMLETKRPDDIIPMMVGLSSVFSKTDKSPFSPDTFKTGWIASQSAVNFMQSNNPRAFEALKKLI